MYNKSTYFKFELYTIHVGSINAFGGSKVPIFGSGFFHCDTDVCDVRLHTVLSTYTECMRQHGSAF